MSRLSSIGVLPEAFRHRVWRFEESLRSALGKDQLGFAKRSVSRARVRMVTPRNLAGTKSAAPRAATAGLLSASARSAFSLAAAHFGIDLRTGDGPSIFRRATTEQWPLVAVTADAGPTVRGADALSYLRAGGTIFIGEITPAADAWLQALARELGVELPRSRPLAQRAAALTFSALRPEITAEMSGLEIQNDEGDCFLEASPAVTPIAWLSAGGDLLPAVVEIRVAGGRLVLAAGPPRGEGMPVDLLQPEHALAMLPSFLMVRSIYGAAAWHSPLAMANFTIDDPMLRQGLLGLDFKSALAAASADNFHLTVATVPRELHLADPSTVALLARNHGRISACYHGNDHDGYEFFASDNGHSRFRSRPLERQRGAIREAAARGREFARRTGHALDRVMVFPHGLGPASVIGELGACGFLATSNWLDRYPLGASRPDDEDAGMRPADLAWNGFPLLWRRNLADETFPFDLMLGRPVLYFGHRSNVGDDFEPVRALARRVNQVAISGVSWLGLEEITRHGYVQRRRPNVEAWDVLMTANLACLHNPSTATRRYRVHRPYLPSGGALTSGADVAHGSDLELEVTPGATALVRVARPGAETLPDPMQDRPCAVGHVA